MLVFYVTRFFEEGLHRPYFPGVGRRWCGEDRSVFLETVWAAVPEERWESAETLGRTSGVDADTLKRVVDFLVRWDFVETERFPELRIRRKAGALSPVEVVGLLRTVTSTQPTPLKQNGRARLAERVACRTCGNRNLTFLTENEVECTKCHERQWFAIEKPEKDSDSMKPASGARPNVLKRLQVHMGFPNHHS